MSPFLPLVLSSIALVAPTNASPWININKREETNQDKFSNAPSTSTTSKKSTTTTTTKKSTSTSSSAKKTSTAKAVSSASTHASSSVHPKSSASIVPTSTAATSSVPPLMVVAATSSASSNNAAASASSSLSASQNDTSSSGGISGGAIGGIVAAIIIIIGGIIAYLFLRKRKNNANSSRSVRSTNARMSKPDPFTMGFGNDASNNYPQMQQQTYQHQYGTTSTAQSTLVMSPTSPTSPYNTQQFHDANNHIIAGSMMPAISQPPHSNNAQQYQPATIYQQDQPDSDSVGVAITSSSALSIPNSGPAPLLQPTQAGSIGVYYVAATYTPTLSDEIDIQTGDQVEVLVEYDDGWCQGINLTRGGAKGVFPKHCIDYNNHHGSTDDANHGADRAKRVSSMYVA